MTERPPSRHGPWLWLAVVYDPRCRAIRTLHWLAERMTPGIPSGCVTWSVSLGVSREFDDDGPDASLGWSPWMSRDEGELGEG